jgi:S-adenosylmethionine hydrolase
LIRLELPEPRRDGRDLVVHAVYIDHFGNVQLNAGHEDLPESGLRLGRRVRIDPARGEVTEAQFVRTFADVQRGELLLYEDAYRRLAVAVSHGDAAAQLRIAIDDELRIRPG